MRKAHKAVEPVEPDMQSTADAQSTAPAPSAEAPAVKEPERKPASITVTYVGDPRGGPNPENTVFAGVPMPKGKPVVIDDAAWIEKFAFRFRRNKHFRVE